MTLITTLDAETTAFVHNGKRTPSPFIGDNYLVSIGWKNAEGFPYLCARHNDMPPSENLNAIVQDALDRTSLLIGHNLKFDLLWLYACDFKYNGKLWDTMIWEFVNAKGTNIDLDLSSCCQRHGIETKMDEVSEMFDKGMGFEEIPWPKVELYGRQDITITEQLYLSQVGKKV